jgi:hypothetical protein
LPSELTARPSRPVAVATAVYWLMRLSGEGRKSGGDLVDVGADVGGGGAGVAAPVGVPCVGMGHGVAEVAFHPGQGGVAQPVGADLLDGYPRQVLADALP